MRIKAALLAVGLAVSGLVGLAGTANACTTEDGGHTCMYSAADLTGFRWDDDAKSTERWADHSYIGTSVRLYAGDGVPNNVSSMDNWDRDSTVAVYYNSRYRGGCFTIAAYGQVSNMARIRLTDGTNANDRMNSHHYNRTCGPVHNF